MQLKTTNIPEEIIEQYKLKEIETSDGFIYCEVKKGMYGLPQSGITAQQLFKERLSKVGYFQSKIIPGLWKHKTRSIIFCLVVDNFAIKYQKKEDVDHLLNALKKDYEVTEDWTGTKYVGLTVVWDYQNRKVHLWMPGYIKKVLVRFKHDKHEKIQNSRHPHAVPAYGTEIQYAEIEDSTPKLGKNDKISNSLQGHSSTMHEQSTAQYSQPSAQLLPNKRLPWKKR
jgi:hypothetical protein